MHRIGRTARAGATGTAYTFFTAKDASKARELIKIMEEAKQEVPPRLRDMAAASYGGGGGGEWNGVHPTRGTRAVMERQVKVVF